MQNIQTSPRIKKLLTELANYDIHQVDEEKCLYKYVKMETARLILANHSMKFSTSVELNDNDLDSCLLNHNYSRNFIKSEQNKLFNESLQETLPRNAFNLYNRKSVRKFLQKHPLGKAMRKKFSSSTIIEEHIKAFEAQKTTIGLFCATTGSDKNFMWESEKYGDNEKGFCIEYKFPSLYNDIFNAFTVCYDREMKPRNYLKNDKMDEVSVHRWLCTKSKRYKDEDEIRLLSPVGKVGICSVPIETFTGLYYGKKTPTEHIEELESLLKEVGYTFTTATKAIY